MHTQKGLDVGMTPTPLFCEAPGVTALMREHENQNIQIEDQIMLARTTAPQGLLKVKQVFFEVMVKSWLAFMENLKNKKNLYFFSVDCVGFFD